jgi:hypothetical protein
VGARASGHAAEAPLGRRRQRWTGASIAKQAVRPSFHWGSLYRALTPTLVRQRPVHDAAPRILSQAYSHSPLPSWWPAPRLIAARPAAACAPTTQGLPASQGIDQCMSSSG